MLAEIEALGLDLLEVRQVILGLPRGRAAARLGPPDTVAAIIEIVLTDRLLAQVRP